MRRFALVGLGVLGALMAFPAVEEAQAQDRPLVLRVRPRSFLDPGPVAPVGTFNRYATQGQLSYLTSPPYAPNGERFGMGVLPDPVTNGPFVGARNPFPPLGFTPDIEATGSIR